MLSARAKRLLTLVALLILSSFSHSLAQQNTDSLVFNVSVTDEKGRMYRGLKPENFAASVDKAPRRIVAVTTDNQPLNVGLLVDVFTQCWTIGHKRSAKILEKPGMVRPDF